MALLGYIILTAALGLESTSVCAQTNTSVADPALQKVRQLLAIPEAQLDLTKAKLTIDHLVDPSVDVGGTLQQINAMVAQIKFQLPPNASKHDTLVALQKYLYTPGPWNDQRPFGYDFDDPFGRIIHNKLLSTYLSTRKGNCVSMPYLVIALGQKLGLDVTAASAPEHVLVKFRDEKGQVFNFEATSGVFKSEAGYLIDFAMTSQAIASGIYLRRLSKRETVALMAGTLLEVYHEKGQEERRIALANLILKVDPRDVTAMLQLGNAYVKIMKRDFISKYPIADEIPAAERPRFMELYQGNQFWFNRAESLGWRQPTQAQDASYLQVIERKKTTH
jgi:regulator of sirC expression with transglutaminase-like and TPR domain